MDPGDLTPRESGPHETHVFCALWGHLQLVPAERLGSCSPTSGQSRGRNSVLFRQQVVGRTETRGSEWHSRPLGQARASTHSFSFQSRPTEPKARSPLGQQGSDSACPSGVKVTPNTHAQVFSGCYCFCFVCKRGLTRSYFQAQFQP